MTFDNELSSNGVTKRSVSSGGLGANPKSVDEKTQKITSSSSDRNFRRSYAGRRNGTNIAGSTRRRIRCEKTRSLARGAEAAERNAANVRGVLQSMSDFCHEDLFLMLGTEARF